MQKLEHASKLTVHEHQGTGETSLYWLPLWTTAAGVIRAKVAPAGSTPKNVDISARSIRLVGKLTETYAMTSSTKKEARAKALL